MTLIFQLIFGGFSFQIPKTTSGKIRRRETKNRFLGGNLKILNKEKKLQFEEDFGIPDDPEFQEENEKNVKENVQNVKSKSEQKSLVEQVAEMLEVNVNFRFLPFLSLTFGVFFYCHKVHFLVKYSGGRVEF